MVRMKAPFLLFALAAASAAAATGPDPSIHCIRFDGNQYVDTGVPARTGVKIELVAEWANPNADSGVFGARIGDIRFYPVHVYEGRLAYGAGGFNKIWQDGALVRHYVPVLADNGAPYLWDKVSKTFAVSQTDYAFWDSGEPGERFERPTLILIK